MGPNNITIECWELSLNLSRLAQLFNHPKSCYILRVQKTRVARLVLCKVYYDCWFQATLTKQALKCTRSASLCVTPNHEACLLLSKPCEAYALSLTTSNSSWDWFNSLASHFLFQNQKCSQLREFSKKRACHPSLKNVMHTHIDLTMSTLPWVHINILIGSLQLCFVPIGSCDS